MDQEYSPDTLSATPRARSYLRKLLLTSAVPADEADTHWDWLND